MNNDVRSRAEDARPEALGISLGDVYFVLFRRKWLILAFTLLGLLAAAAFWKQPLLYQSEAKLLVRYVLETRSPSALGTEPQFRSPDASGDGVINSEVEILTSTDIAREVAQSIGPDGILGKVGGNSNLSAAAMVIRSGVKPSVPVRSSIIVLRFKHPDPEIAQAVLERLIEVYLKKHVDIHRNVGLFDEFLTQQTDSLRLRLGTTEEALRNVGISQNGIVSLEESKTAYVALSSKIRQELLDAEAELAQRRSALDELRKMGRTNSEPVVPITSVPQGKIDEYRKISARVEYLERRDQEFSTILTMENALVKTNRLQLEEARTLKDKLETENPSLLRVSIIPSTSSAGGMVPTDTDLVDQAAQVKAWEARVYFLSNQFVQVRAEAKAVENVETVIAGLQRKKAQEEAQFIYFEKSLQEARFDDALGSGKLTNISKVQAPSPPARDSEGLFKRMGMAILGGLALGVGLAFLIELVLNRTFKSPKDVETLLAMPLFLTIPRLRLPSSRSLAGKINPSTAVGLGGPTNSEFEPNGVNGKDATALWERSHGLRPFHEALRDRLLNLFEVREVTHKPKLVAVTSCTEGAGVSSIATGLAAALSETGDGNVLLVDMKTEREAAHSFSQGKPVCGLAEALESDTRGGAPVQQNLYVVSANNEGDKVKPVLPRRFSHFVPKLMSSDYDYIIFDMPPVSQTSITGRIAKYMDMIFIVIDSEKTDREVAETSGCVIGRVESLGGDHFQQESQLCAGLASSKSIEPMYANSMVGLGCLIGPGIEIGFLPSSTRQK